MDLYGYILSISFTPNQLYPPSLGPLKRFRSSAATSRVPGLPNDDSPSQSLRGKTPGYRLDKVYMGVDF